MRRRIFAFSLRAKLSSALRDGNYVAQRFLINPDSDFLPYVVAGRYQEKVIPSRQGEVQFWTFHPMDGPAAQAAAERLSSSMKTFTEFFGPASNGKTPVRIAEAPAVLPAEFGASLDPGGASFPEGVLLDPRAFQQGIASEAVLQLAEYELARTWFGWRVRPRPEAQILMGRGVGLFGLVIAAEGRGQDQRRGMVASLIDRYDEARAAAPDKRLMEPPAGYSRAERISTGYRAALFLWPWKICAAMTTCAPHCAISFMTARAATPATKSSGPRRNPHREKIWRKCFAPGSFNRAFPTIFALGIRRLRPLAQASELGLVL